MKEKGRFYVADGITNIPLRAQPENGYTWLKAIERAQREIEKCIRLLVEDFMTTKAHMPSWIAIFVK